MNMKDYNRTWANNQAKIKRRQIIKTTKEIVLMIFLTFCLIVSLGTIFALFMDNEFFEARGIIMLENYEHAVAICEGHDAPETELVVMRDWTSDHVSSYMWTHNGVMYTVNGKHLGDAQVYQLTKKAERECAKLNKW